MTVLSQMDHTMNIIKQKMLKYIYQENKNSTKPIKKYCNACGEYFKQDTFPQHSCKKYCDTCDKYFTKNKFPQHQCKKPIKKYCNECDEYLLPSIFSQHICKKYDFICQNNDLHNDKITVINNIHIYNPVITNYLSYDINNETIIKNSLSASYKSHFESLSLSMISNTNYTNDIRIYNSIIHNYKNLSFT